MNIGIIGLGVVGGALRAGFEQKGFNISVHDIKFNSTLQDVLNTEIVYLCLPTPCKEDLTCDTTIIESTIQELYELGYTGCIAIKSTCIPGTTQKLIDRFDDRIMIVPEFLKERTAAYDFVFRNNLLVIGATNLIHSNTIKQSHEGIAERTVRVSPTEAELIKYMHNSFGAMRIVFANVFFEMSQKLQVNYDTVKQAFIEKDNFPDEYFDVTPELRKYAGACFPKDMNALNQFTQGELELPYKLWEAIIEQNNHF